MPFKKRFEHPSFVQNQDLIEKDWDKNFQDRKNEIVIIGIDIDKEKIETDLKNCLLCDKELSENDWKLGYEDEWPVVRVKPLN